MKESTFNGKPLPNSSLSRQSAAPIAVLVFLSPVLAELLMGATRLTNIWLLIPEMAVYGSAALLIREVVRRKGRGWRTILPLGIAFALAEECVILQTSLTPEFFPQGSFGLVAGVQWIYLVALVWYESVYAIVLPIYLTEMLFPHQRDARWLSDRGLVIICVIFVAASTGVWQLWHRFGLQRYASTPYEIPPAYIAAALLAIIFLVAVVLIPRWPAASSHKTARRTPGPWLVGLLSFGFGLLWFVLIALVYVPGSNFQNVSLVIPIAVGLVWIAAGLVILSGLSSTMGWNDRHRLALIFGMILASMAGGTLTVITAAPLDIMGKFAFDLIAIVLLSWFTIRLRRRPL